MINESNIFNSILEIPVKPETSFQVSHLERNAGEPFDRVLQSRVDSRRDEAAPSFETRERPSSAHSQAHTPVSKDEQTPPLRADNHQSDSRPVAPNSERQEPAPPQGDETPSDSSEPKIKERVNPFALPLEQLAPDTNPVNVLDGLFNNRLSEEGSAAIDTLTELLAGLNIDSETINQLVEAVNNGDTAGVQGILNSLRGSLQTANPIAQSTLANIVAEIAGNRLSPSDQRALLVRAGLTHEEAQQLIQQVRATNVTQSATDHSTQLAKTALDAITAKLNSENSSGSGNLQNGDTNGSAKNASDGPRNFSGLAGERLDTLASLVAPDKAGNVQTNPLIAKSSASPLLNLNASGQPAQGVLAEGVQASATVADAAAKGAEMVKPAVTETYNGRASMDKPITAQIIEKFTLRGFGNNREVQIKLDPPSLGTVRMNVSTSGETVRATIVAENHVVKSVIESNLSQLKDSITHQGVKIDSFNVLVGGNASHSAEGHQSVLDYLGQLEREGSIAHEQAEEIVTLHRPVFMNENQSFSIFA